MNRSRALLISVLAAGVTGGLAATLAGATGPASNGLIAFSRYRTFVLNRPVRREIWVSNPDGSGLRRLTRVKPNYVDVDPGWAPDGSRLVFSRCVPVKGVSNTDDCQIWMVNADGSGQHRLSPACRARTATACPFDGGAVYSPDGKQLAFGRDKGDSKVVDS